MRSTLLSFAFRVFCQISVIILPYFLFDKGTYGHYIYIYSLSQLLAYVLDFGFSLYVLRAKPTGRFFKRILRRLNTRDTAYVALGALLCCLYPTFVPYITGTVVGALWVGRLAKARITLGVKLEGISLCVNALGILIALGICFWLERDNSAEVFLAVVVVPRVAALITAFTLSLLADKPRLHIEAYYRPRSFIKDVYWLYPYAVQGIFTAATMNVDTLIMTGLGASPVIIADVKLLMTLIGGLSMPVDIIGQYKISSSSDEAEYSQRFKKLLHYERITVLLATLASVVATMALVRFKGVPLLTFAILPISVWLRSKTIIIANFLTMSGRSGQSSRITKQVAANLIYWTLLVIGAALNSLHVYLVAILILSISHYALMRMPSVTGKAI
ncbi:hypothetical protein [[Pseudomonas] boreopolis]|uniref:hypothetical protein n=1 Tax=Xanthomonas boreopolis TaxID=86183 RepID=UPI003D9B383E